MPASVIVAAALRAQGTVGNRALARSLAAAPRTLARYESPEHEDLGDRYAADLARWIVTDDGQAWVAKYGLQQAVKGMETDWYALGKRKLGGAAQTLSVGEIVALSGDFYESPEALAAAPAEELRALVEAIGRERKGELANANATYEEITKQHRSDTSRHYLELAKRNTPHFTPGNRREWRKLHAQAVALAKQPQPGRAFDARSADPGAKHDSDFERALFVDAAAGHFLTDAFAAGHLFDKDRLELDIESHLRLHPARPDNPELSLHYGLVGALTPQLVLKNIHDRLNVEGVEVSNARGMTWRTRGDQHLAAAPETQKIAALALYMSRQQIFRARAGEDPDPREVEAMLPDDASIAKATELAQRFIPAAVEDLTGLMYRQRGMVKTQAGPFLGAIIESNLATIAAPGRERQLLDVKERAERTGSPQVAPQFTLGSW